MWSLLWPMLRSWLLGRGLRALGYLAAAAAALGVLLGARRAGRNAERLERVMRNAEIRHAQLEAAARRPRSRGELARILRDGSF